MSSVIYNPLEEYEKTLKDFHIKKANEFFDDIVRRSNVNIEENRKTVEQYNTYKEQGESLGVIEPMNQYRQAILEKLLSDYKIDEKLANDLVTLFGSDFTKYYRSIETYGGAK